MQIAGSSPLTTDPQHVASMLQGLMVGVSRRMLESAVPESQFDVLRQEMIFPRARVPERLFCESLGRRRMPLPNKPYEQLF